MYAGGANFCDGIFMIRHKDSPLEMMIQYAQREINHE